jgi:hypothetical protein
VLASRAVARLAAHLHTQLHTCTAWPCGSLSPTCHSLPAVLVHPQPALTPPRSLPPDPPSVQVRMLRRALDRFPAGTGKRWEVVQAYVRTRTVDEILDMVKHGLKAGGGSAPGAWAAVAAARRVCTCLVGGGWAATAEVCGVSGRLAGLPRCSSVSVWVLRAAQAAQWFEQRLHVFVCALSPQHCACPHHLQADLGTLPM